jgi:mono/diheme cytochrome c family protein
MRRSSALAAAMAIFLTHANVAHAESPQVARGKYLVQVGGCNDCHTAGSLVGKPDTAHSLGGGEVGFELPGLGVFVPPNLTPDKDTGLGNWTRQEIMKAVRTGTRPDGRILAPVMPWRGYAVLTDTDAGAITDYLKSLPPVAHKVPGPFGPSETLTVPRFTVVPPPQTAQH